MNALCCRVWILFFQKWCGFIRLKCDLNSQQIKSQSKMNNEESQYLSKYYTVKDPFVYGLKVLCAKEDILYEVVKSECIQHQTNCLSLCGIAWRDLLKRGNEGETVSLLTLWNAVYCHFFFVFLKKERKEGTALNNQKTARKMITPKAH